MKKIMTRLLMAVLLIALLSGCTAVDTTKPTDSNATDTSWEYIQAKGEFIVGLDDTFAPMGFRNESGELVGFDIDLATAVAERMGVEVKFQPIDWDAKELELNAKKIDCIWNGMSVTPSRKESMLLSEPYLNNTLIIMVKKGTTDIKNKADLVGKKIGVQAKSSGLEALVADSDYESNKANITEYRSYDEALMDLEIGRVQAVVIDEVLGRYKATMKPDAFDFVDEKFADDLYAIGMR